MFQEAIDAIRLGQQARARDLLTRLLRADQNNLEYWLWMSAVVNTPKEQIYCLQTALRLDPENRVVQQGLTLLGARAPAGEVTPVPPVRRKWEVKLQEVPKYSALGALWANPAVRISFFTFLTLLLIGLLIMGAYGWAQRRKPVAIIIPTKTHGPSPTFTCTVTAINYTPPAVTASAIDSGPPPLWMRLEATYTPTPLYVNTPHIASYDSIQAALRALNRGDTNAALEYFNQAMEIDKSASDIPYYIGEVYRQLGDYENALEYYEKSQTSNPDFAPAYLGIARVEPLLYPKSDISQYLQTAIEKDPSFGEAYLERAGFRLNKGDAQGALDDLEKAEELIPGSPLIYLYRAQIALAVDNTEEALEYARKANQMDQTLLLSYRLLGEAAAESGDIDEGLEAISVYLDYVQDDPAAWVIQGQGLYARGEYSGTMNALNQAIELDKNLPEAYFYRGLAYIELEQGQKAVNDIYYAVQSNPYSFEVNLGFGRALLAAGRPGDAFAQVNRSLNLAKTDQEKAQAHYWRAKVYEAIGNMGAAIRDWNALLDLPEEAVPEEWIEYAEAHIETTSTPVPTFTSTPTATKASPTPKATATTSVTPTSKATTAPESVTPASPTPSPTPK
jgi:tetratricopeptide (TPR) repeat protein